MRLPPVKRYFFLTIHLVFLASILYAFYHFLRTPRIDAVNRRLWAYENWIIVSFYGLFVYLALSDVDIPEEIKERRKKRIAKFQRILEINLLLLLFPWGLFLLLVPGDLLAMVGLGSAYWRVLGGFSIAGFLLYLFPLKLLRHKISYYVLLFGIVDNFLAGLIVVTLFFLERVPLVALSAAPLLFYFSYFFFETTRRYRAIA
ncbi:hypothetical protein A3A64_03170 [Candidatus Gottesmanbacteria bacterium RIFCSPLOWO2_01_FULL_48_11]|uniref:Uncharacterized protein n=2 Tax=Candidatus Gottesmaniibacteriota TaxID=1752720 RepID=A0A0G1WAJ8_9BACT|nr:MAG: hypothetical protein UY16_C0029G0002 [Candidatus Gottesmanbacteria bacterium GW2011_GWA2_47_9]OGG28147.1 MAG: hypothetical protein A3A64_03170 [Candidatus Gottesmanbacteria bacterium RIFCSPLOWO2_01_FULL_48_11]